MFAIPCCTPYFLDVICFRDSSPLWFALGFPWLCLIFSGITPCHITLIIYAFHSYLTGGIFYFLFQSAASRVRKRVVWLISWLIPVKSSPEFVAYVHAMWAVIAWHASRCVPCGLFLIKAAISHQALKLPWHPVTFQWLLGLYIFKLAY